MVEKENKNRGLFLGIAAGALVVGAALMYHYFFADAAEEEEETASQLQQALEEAGLSEVKKRYASDGNA